MSITSNADEVAASLGKVASAVPVALKGGLKVGGRILQAQIQALAPVDTGDYRRSWTTRSFGSRATPSVSVGTNKVQGPRLEFGFMNMTDALGRRFQQKAQPHVEPALKLSQERVIAALTRTVNTAIDR